MKIFAGRLLPLLLIAGRGFAQEQASAPQAAPVTDATDQAAQQTGTSEQTAQAPAQTPPQNAPQTRAEHSKADAEAPPDKRVLGVLPNYRTINETGTYTPISAKGKLTIAAKDSFDYPLIILSGAFAGISQLENSSPSFGQGVKGFAHRLATNYADQALGNMMTEGFMPALLHEDPRYRRLGSSRGTVKYRAWYAASRVFVTRTDSGGTRFNYSEWSGNAIAVAISNTYYPDNRTWGDNATKLITQCGTDALSQVLKEFWPDIKHKFFHKNPPASN